MNQEKSSVKLAKAQRVFVNRSLNMGYIKSIGFDMDHTIVTYNRENFEALAFQLTLTRLIEMGYPKSLSRLKFSPDSVIRGLLVDKERGNLLKVDGHKYVKLAFHGRRMLDKEERHTIYNAESFKAEVLRSVDTFFALSEVQLFIEIVDLMRREPQRIKKPYEQIYSDIQTCINSAHRDGSLKSIITKDPEKYIDRDDEMADTLTRLIEGGKSLFLLTNSHWEFTNVVMSHILNGRHEVFKDWKDYFDYIIVGSGKPDFFTGSQPFYEVVQENGLFKQFSGRLSTNKVYHGGNAHLLQKLAGFKGDEILYVGDHMYGDIIRSKGLFNWRTMLVVPELEHELEVMDNHKEISKKIEELLNKREAIDEQLQLTRNRIKLQEKMYKKSVDSGDTKKAESYVREKEKLIDKINEMENDLANLDDEVRKHLDQRDSEMNKVWGQTMKVGMDKSRFAHQLELYACLYTSRVSNMRFYSPFKRYNAPHEILPHDL